MKFALALTALLAVVVRAQNSTLIPSNITSSCSSFLVQLNADTTLADCINPLINVTSSFSPTSTDTPSTSEINYTLASLCAANSGCNDATVRSWLAKFYAACTTELTSATGYNSDVRELYDILYVFNPLRGAVCAIDSANQDYCVNEIRKAESSSANSTSSSNSTSSANSTSTASSNSTGVSNNTLITSNLLASAVTADPIAIASQFLYTIYSSGSSLKRSVSSFLNPRDASQQSFETVILPNATTYQSTNLPFLFLQPNMSSSALCTPCTREVMVAYIKWEAQQPYALGLSASPILGGQSALWSGISATCGSSFTSAIISEAGVYVTSGNSTSAAGQSVTVAAGSFVGAAVIAGAVALFA